MQTIGVIIAGAAINALAFSRTNYLFSTLSGHGKERKMHGLLLNHSGSKIDRRNLTGFLKNVNGNTRPHRSYPDEGEYEKVLHRYA